MKVRTLIVTFGIVCVGSQLFGADSAFERDVKQLSKQRDKEIEAAVEPINRRYQAALEQLLRRATQANDLDSAIKIKAALAAIPSSVQLLKAKPKSAEDLKAFLAGTTWDISFGLARCEAVQHDDLRQGWKL